MLTFLKGRRVTNSIRYVLDNWLPPAVREFRPLAKVLALAFHGRHFDLDFKRRAHQLSDEEFAAAYDRLKPNCKRPYRLTDMTEAQLVWMTRHALGPDVLEVGCGWGVLAERLTRRGDLRVTATDLAASNIENARRRLATLSLPIHWRQADSEKLPFADKSFDSTLCAHTLEHVRDFDRAVSELCRVTRRRLLIVVPCQRYYRYTIDYHLHFFAEPEELVRRLRLPVYHCERVNGDLCYRADLSEEVR